MPLLAVVVGRKGKEEPGRGWKLSPMEGSNTAWGLKLGKGEGTVLKKTPLSLNGGGTSRRVRDAGGQVTTHF